MDPNNPDYKTYESQENLAPVKRTGGALEFIKKYWFLLFLTAFAVLLSLLWFTGNRDKKQVRLPEKIESFELVGQPISENTQITFSPIDIKTSDLPLLTVRKKAQISLTDAVQIALAFGFSGNPQTLNDAITGPVWAWSEIGKSMTITPSTREITYIISPIEFPPPQTGDFPSTQDLLANSQNLIAALSLSTKNIKTQEEFVGGNGLPTRSSDSAIYKSVILTPTYKGAELIQFTGQDYLANLFFDRTGRLDRLVSVDNLAEIIPSSNMYPIKSLEEIKSSIKSDGKIYSVGERITTEEFKTINISTISSGYLISKTGSTAHPLFVLYGLGQDVYGSTHEVKLILPAIKREVYK